MSFPFFGESLELNETTRAAADGSFVSLPDGVTHYELGSPLHEGEGKGVREVVVLVHGFSVPYYIFDPTFDFLTQAGFRDIRRVPEFGEFADDGSGYRFLGVLVSCNIECFK